MSLNFQQTIQQLTSQISSVLNDVATLMALPQPTNSAVAKIRKKDLQRALKLIQIYLTEIKQAMMEPTKTTGSDWYTVTAIETMGVPHVPICFAVAETPTGVILGDKKQDTGQDSTNNENMENDRLEQVNQYTTKGTLWRWDRQDKWEIVCALIVWIELGKKPANLHCDPTEMLIVTVAASLGNSIPFGKRAEFARESRPHPDLVQAAVETMNFLSIRGPDSKLEAVNTDAVASRAETMFQATGDLKTRLVQVWTDGNETRVLTALTYFLRAGVKNATALGAHYTLRRDTLAGWAGVPVNQLPTTINAAIGEQLSNSMRKYTPAIALHCAWAYMADPEAYLELKRWFASRYEFFGLSYLTLISDMRETISFEELSYHIGTPANGNLLSKIYVSYAAYMCTLPDVYLSYNKKVATVGAPDSLSVADCKTGRFCRCFSSRFLPWATFFNNQRLAQMLLGITVSLGLRSEENLQQFSVTLAYKVGRELGILIAANPPESGTMYSREAKQALELASKQMSSITSAPLAIPTISVPRPTTTEQEPRGLFGKFKPRFLYSYISNLIKPNQPN